MTNSTPTVEKAEEPTDSEQAPAFDAEAETVTDAWEGTFIYTSWGYDQTNVNVAQIIDVSASGKTILARLVVAETVEQSNASEHLRPTPKPYGDEFRLHVRSSRDQPAFRGSYPYINGDMDKGTRLDSFLPVENAPDNTVRQTAQHHRHSSVLVSHSSQPGSDDRSKAVETTSLKPTAARNATMADLIVKAAVRDAIDGNVSGDFYDALDEEVHELLDEAARRADENNRKTVQARDL